MGYDKGHDREAGFVRRQPQIIDSWGNVIRRVPFGRGLDVLKEGIIIDD